MSPHFSVLAPQFLMKCQGPYCSPRGSVLPPCSRLLGATLSLTHCLTATLASILSTCQPLSPPGPLLWLFLLPGMLFPRCSLTSLLPFLWVFPPMSPQWAFPWFQFATFCLGLSLPFHQPYVSLWGLFLQNQQGSASRAGSWSVSVLVSPPPLMHCRWSVDI